MTANAPFSQGFGESPYLNRRLRETFEPQGVRIVVPDIPALVTLFEPLQFFRDLKVLSFLIPLSHRHIAVSEGALTFYLSEKLRNPRKTRFRLGFEVAVEWHKNDNEETFKRDVFFGSGGNELLQGKFGTLVEAVSRTSLFSSPLVTDEFDFSGDRSSSRRTFLQTVSHALSTLHGRSSYRYTSTLGARSEQCSSRLDHGRRRFVLAFPFSSLDSGSYSSTASR